MVSEEDSAVIIICFSACIWVHSGCLRDLFSVFFPQRFEHVMHMGLLFPIVAFTFSWALILMCDPLFMVWYLLLTLENFQPPFFRCVPCLSLFPSVNLAVHSLDWCYNISPTHSSIFPPFLLSPGALTWVISGERLPSPQSCPQLSRAACEPLNLLFTLSRVFQLERPHATLSHSFCLFLGRYIILSKELKATWVPLMVGSLSMLFSMPWNTLPSFKWSYI